MSSVAVVMLACGTARAEMWEDYAASKEAWTVTQVKVQAGKVDDYLKGLKRGFVPAAELAKKNGTLVDYQILVNRNQVAPGATVLILEKYADWSQFAPNKERDLKKRAELRKTLPKEESDKLVNGFNGYRTFVDEGSYWGVEFAK
jgi:hypothetical protein